MAEKMIKGLGGLTFGIYLLEEFGRREIIGVFEFLKPHSIRFWQAWYGYYVSASCMELQRLF